MSMSEEEYRQQAQALWREHDELQRWIGGQATHGLRLTCA